jgi:hypothetical protein
MEDRIMRKKKFTKNVAVLLSDEQYDRLLWITDLLEMPLSEFIRNAVDGKMDSEIRKLKQDRLTKDMDTDTTGKGTNES